MLLQLSQFFPLCPPPPRMFLYQLNIDKYCKYIYMKMYVAKENEIKNKAVDNILI